jgi:hypothetical protein
MHAIGRAQASGEELRYKEAFSTDSLDRLTTSTDESRNANRYLG